MNQAKQYDIDLIWKEVWREPARPSRILQTRLTNDGFAAINRHIPSDTAQILEVGTGTGRFGALLAKERPAAVVTMTDVLPESLAIARKMSSELRVTNVRFEEADANAMPFPSESFDAVLSDAVVQHLPEEQQAWNEMARVVRPGGTVIVSVVNRWNPHTLFKRLQGKKYHYGFERSYSHADLKRRAREAGLVVEAEDGFFPAYGVTRLTRRHRWIKPFGRSFDLLCRLGDRMTRGWVSRTFGFELVVVAQKRANRKNEQ